MRKVLHLENHFARAAGLFSGDKFDLASHHQFSQLAHVSDLINDDTCCSHLTLTQHRTAVADSLDLRQFMADEDDRLLLGNQLPDDIKKPFHFLRSQDCCRFVHDQRINITIESFQNFQALLLSD